MYDFIVVGSGLFGAIFTYEATKAGNKVLVLEKRSHVGGNLYTEELDGIQVHRYGAHIFHTDNMGIWEYVNQFATFNRYTNAPIARYRNEIYNLPFNMNTFHQMWGIHTPEEARSIIEAQICASGISEPANLEEQGIMLVGNDIYFKLIKGYTEKQWGCSATQLPAFIIKRLPVRFVYDNNYFNDTYQGIPVGGYTQIIEKMLQCAEVKTGVDFLENRYHWMSMTEKTVFTGMIDAFYDYRFGELAYRSLRFETERLNCDNYQGNAVVNYTEYEVPYTRIIEHKHFEMQCQGSHPRNPVTVITKEYPMAWNRGKEPFYPVNDKGNSQIYQKYRALALCEPHIIFGGRLGTYQYLDMHNVIAQALQCIHTELR